LTPGVEIFVDPQFLAQDILVDKNDLTSGMMTQTGSIVYYGELCARAEAQVAHMKQAMELMEAQLIRDMRGVYVAKGDAKVSETRLEKEIKLSPQYIRAQNSLRDAKYVHTLLLSIMDAFDHRRSMLIQSAKTMVNTFHGNPSVSAQD
jgi:predicted component of type VI protein secretion system